MKLSLIFLSTLVTLGLATPTSTACNANNCARAVTGTRLGASHVATARADCSSLLALPASLQTLPASVSRNCPDFNKYSSACSCWGAVPTTPPACGGANLDTDPNNCGTCGNVCPSGTCINGACKVAECEKQVCGSFTNCALNGGNCQCYSTADGSGFCASSQLCANLLDCSTTEDCPSGSVCVVQSCCTRNVCLPAQCNNPGTKLMLMAKRGSDDCMSNDC